MRIRSPRQGGWGRTTGPPLGSPCAGDVDRVCRAGHSQRSHAVSPTLAVEAGLLSVTLLLPCACAAGGRLGSLDYHADACVRMAYRRPTPGCV